MIELSEIFKTSRKFLGDTFKPYRNSDEDFASALSSFISYLKANHPDHMLDDNFQISDNFTKPFERSNSTVYSLGDMIFINDPMDIYSCSVAGTSNSTEPDFIANFVTDNTTGWTKWHVPGSIDGNAVIHYITWFCLIMDTDEQANEAKALFHEQKYKELL